MESSAVPVSSAVQGSSGTMAAAALLVMGGGNGSVSSGSTMVTASSGPRLELRLDAEPDPQMKALVVADSAVASVLVSEVKKEKQDSGEEKKQKLEDEKVEEKEKTEGLEMGNGGVVGISGATGTTGVTGSSTGKERDYIWTEEAVHVLLDHFVEKYLSYDRGMIRNADWVEIAQRVNQQLDSSKPSKTPEQCKNKVDNLKKQYRKERRRGSLGPSSTNWVFFSRMHDIFGDSLSFKKTGSPGALAPEPLDAIPAIDMDRANVVENRSNLQENCHPASVSPPPPDFLRKQDEFLKRQFRHEVQPEQHHAQHNSSCETPRQKTKFSMGSGKSSKRHRSELSALRKDFMEGFTGFAEVMLKVEVAKMEMQRDLERQRAEMELHRTQLMLNNQLQLARYLRTNPISPLENCWPNFSHSDKVDHSGGRAGRMQLAIPIFPGFTALDAIGPYEVLHLLPNVEVQFISHQPGLYSADLGMLSIQATGSFDQIRRPEIVLVPGGPGIRQLLQDRTILDWLRKVHENTMYTASVCTGSLLLGAAGLLEGLEATTHWTSHDLLAGFGAKPVTSRIVQQGKIITAAGVSAGIDMALQLAALLSDETTAKTLQLYIEYDPQPPFDTGSVTKAGAELTIRARELSSRIRAHTAGLRGAVP